MFKVSYLISAYKAERFMENRLRNLLCEQSDDSSEVIIVDSASPESEGIIADKWQQMFPERVKYIRQVERTSYGASWLEAWQHAEGLFVCNANSDDLIGPDFTKAAFAALYSSFLKKEK